MTTNKPMTGEQLDELLAVAVRMQRDAEVDRNFPSANFAYAVQVAVLELRRTREIATVLAAENAGLKAANAEGCKWDGEQWVGISIETPSTDAFLAEVRAQHSESICVSILEKAGEYEARSKEVDCHTTDNRYRFAAAMFRGFAAQLRQEAAK